MRLKGAAIWMGVVIARIVEDWNYHLSAYNKARGTGPMDQREM